MRVVYVDIESHKRVSYDGHVDETKTNNPPRNRFGIYIRFEDGSYAWVAGPVDTVDDGNDDDERPDEWSWHERVDPSSQQRQLELKAAQGLLQRRAQHSAERALAVRVTYVDTNSGQRVSFNGRIDVPATDAAPYGRFGVFVHFGGGGGVHPAWVAGPVNLDDMDVDDEVDEVRVRVDEVAADDGVAVSAPRRHVA